MQDDSGLKRALTSPWIYEGFQRLIGAERVRRWLSKNFWVCPPGAKVVDVGCGPGDVLNYLPSDIDYWGIDISPSYIEQARRKYGSRGQFLVGSAADMLAEPRLKGADLILCTGLLHHLDDAAADSVFRFAHETLAQGGRLLCYEPCYLRHQTWLSRWIMRRDRGQNIRTEEAWQQLARRRSRTSKQRWPPG
jgi:SAM-dependent methyltransferase